MMFELVRETTPARAGLVLLGRPAPGQVVATAVDLALRGCLEVRERAGAWEALPAVNALPVGNALPAGNGGSGGNALPAGTGESGGNARSADRPRRTSTALLAYERALVTWMSPDGGPFVLTGLDADRVAALDTVIDRLVADARRHKLLRRRWPWEWFRRANRLSRRGEELAERVGRLRVRLRVADQNPELMRETFAYLVLFGLHTGPRMRGAPEDLARLAAFARAWHETCADLPGWRRPPSQRPEVDPMQLHQRPLFGPGTASGLGLGGEL